MATGTLAPAGRQQFFTAAGLPLAGGQLFSYASGTSVPSPLYTDAALLVPQANPVVLDSGGYATLYMAALSQKWILKDSTGVTLWTVDPVSALASGVGVTGLGEVFVFGSNSSSPVTVTSYPSGATFDTLVPGSSVWSIDSANLSGTYVLEVTGVQDTAGTLTVALVNLSDGAPDTPIATCAITSLTGQMVQSSAITFPAGGATKLYGIKAQVSANTGFVIGARIMRTA